MSRCKTFALFVAAAALVAVGAGHAQEPEAAKPYTVECGPDPEEGGATVCRVDRGDVRRLANVSRDLSHLSRPRRRRQHVRSGLAGARA